jgi:carboxypeptidase family protein
MRSILKPLVRSLVIGLALAALAACTAAGSPYPSSTGSAAAGSPSPGILSGDAAANEVLTQLGRWRGLGPFDPNAIGQCCGYRVAASPAGWTVTIEVGWGDCPAGCINRHQWAYEVHPDRTIVVVGESGPPVPAGLPGAAASGGPTGGSGSSGPSGAAGTPEPAFATGIRGVALAGPTCPVERPGDSACAPRPVAGATIHVVASDGVEVATLTTDQAGRFAIQLEPGSYRLVADDAVGTMHPPAPIEVRVSGSVVDVQVSYDTGIR